MSRKNHVSAMQLSYTDGANTFTPKKGGSKTAPHEASAPVTTIDKPFIVIVIAGVIHTRFGPCSGQLNVHCKTQIGNPFRVALLPSN
jgi:hypothetical protein